jgi:hypothetical protein
VSDETEDKVLETILIVTIMLSHLAFIHFFIPEGI